MTRVLRVRGIALPDEEPVDLYADGDRSTTEPVAGAELVADGRLVPGLVDAHTGPRARRPTAPQGPAQARRLGVTMIR